MKRSVRSALSTAALGVLCLGTIETASAQYRGHASSFAVPRSQAYVRSAFGAGLGTGFGTGVGTGFNAGFGTGVGYNSLMNNYGGYGGLSPYLLAASMGGGGAVQAPATPYSSTYGSWITSAAAADSQDAIALAQADMSSRFMYQDLKSKRLQHRRAVFDEMRYERENTPSPEELREEMRLQQLQHARNSPPESEINTGAPLNDLLNSVQRTQARESVIGYAIPLDPEILKHINVSTTGDTKGSNEFFKPGKLPEWPLAFDNEVFTADKKRFSDDLFAVGKAQLDGKVDSTKVADARKVLTSLRETLFTLRFNIGTSDYMDGISYLTKLGDVVETLAKPDAKKYLDGTYAAKGDTVGDLLSYMTSKGLKFTRAAPGSESYYSALYQALVTYELGLNRLVGKK